MRTNIVIDEKLMARAMKRAGVKTMREMVDLALREFVSKPDYDALIDLAGSGAIAADYDPKSATSTPRILEQPRKPYRAGAKRSSTGRRKA
ncbi:MAG TPA: type II toxin-antitoxin system VapB family antitoxin [Burkholderiaceae bacterium]|nr:type II toxin-antitoxin system VapB family antitoxin [Burkholderiaceae bacterium]